MRSETGLVGVSNVVVLGYVGDSDVGAGIVVLLLLQNLFPKGFLCRLLCLTPLSLCVFDCLFPQSLLLQSLRLRCRARVVMQLEMRRQRRGGGCIFRNTTGGVKNAPFHELRRG
jgi:hypothetical protein